jgi:tetratricopeptide (TPR) repeat protein
MAKKTKDTGLHGLQNVEETLTRTEQFLEENYKTILYGLGSIIVLIGLLWLGKVYLNKQNEEAKSQMFQAESYFEMDSLKLALNGDGNYLGFLDIANDYKFTKSGNLAKYCAGMCYLHLGEFENAVDYLSKYKKEDKVIGSLAIGGIGDAYVELGDLGKGITKYIEAADYSENAFNTPLFLMKAGQLYEMQGKYDEALKVYTRIRDEYPLSTEGSTIEKYIEKVTLITKE